MEEWHFVGTGWDRCRIQQANQTCCENSKRFAKTYDQDPLAIAASADGVPVFKFKSWRLKGVARPEVLFKTRFQLLWEKKNLYQWTSRCWLSTRAWGPTWMWCLTAPSSFLWRFFLIIINMIIVMIIMIITKVVNAPSLKSICYHPSLLPRHRGASAISWTLIEGDTKVMLMTMIVAMIMMMIIIIMIMEPKSKKFSFKLNLVKIQKN